MMPGDSQSRTVAIAADATIGNCQNCSVLQQNLTEYVSSFLALKQKITVSDDTIRLQQQLEELQIRLGTLETKTADYEHVQAELEEKKHALKAYVDLAEEMENLKHKNVTTLTENKELADQLKDVKEMTEAQSLENSQLKREKAVLENDLLQTRASLKKFQTQAEKVETLMKENSKMTSIKDGLENKVRLLEDSVSKQNQQISKLTKEKNLLEKNIDDLQVRLMKLERERNKEYRSITTQASAPTEPKIDKERFKTLLDNLWTCIQPEQTQASNQLHFTDSSYKQVVLSPPQNVLDSHEKETALPASCKVGEPSRSHTVRKLSPQAPNAIEGHASPRCLRGKKLKSPQKKGKRSPKEDKTNALAPDVSNLEIAFEDIMELFKPMAPCLSPLKDLVESMDVDGTEKEMCAPLTEDLLPLHQEESLHATTPPSNQTNSNTAAFPTKANMDLPVDTKGDSGRISNEVISQNSTQSVLTSQMKDEMKAVNGNVSPQKVVVTEPEPTAVQTSVTELPSLSLDAKALVEPVSIPDGLNLPSSGANSTSGTETENSPGKAKQDQTESLIEMDVETNPSSGTDTTAVAPDDGESPRGTHAPVVSNGTLTTSQATSSTLTTNLKDTDAPKTEHTSDGEKSQDTSTINTQNKEQEMEEVPLSLASEVCVSSDIVEQRTKIDASLMVPAKEEENTTQEAAGDDVSTSVKSNKSPLKMDQEHGQVTDTTPSNNDTGTDTVEIKIIDDHGSSLSNFQEKKTIDGESLKENAHSPCSQLIPRCPSSTTELQTLENHNSAKLKTDDNAECNPSNKNILVPSSEKENPIERPIVQKFPRDNMDAGCAASFIRNAASTHKQNCLQSRTEACEEQGTESETGQKSMETKNSNTALMNQILFEVGSPLPPLLTPLNTTPKTGMSINPRHAIGKLLFPSPMDTLNSPTTSAQAHLTPGSQQQNSSALNSPVPPNGVPSSPLQFGSATPKHAVPVPGRLPPAAITSSQSSSTSPSQENSMRILDSMYPELSARARTLSILRGNVGLAVGSSESGSLQMAADSQVSSFKTLNSTSTAFTKTDVRGEKRPANSLLQPVSKCLRLDSSSADVHEHVLCSASNSGGGDSSPQAPNVKRPKTDIDSGSLEIEEGAKQSLIADSLKKIESQCFDLLPVIRSHLHVGNLPKKPVLRDEEKEVISEICKSSSQVVDEMMLAILDKLKAAKRELSVNSMQALCRVYTGICRQKGYQEKAQLLAYSILTEDFPQCAELVLFMVTTWPTVLSHTSSLCQAIHTVTKLKAADEILSCLSPFLGWEKSPPCDIDHLISRTLSEIQSGVNMSFIKHSRYGDDLNTVAWERVFTLHVLCSHKKWKWTYEHLLGKELWPLMNTWVTQSRDQQEPVSDVTVATVLRLIGCLCQLGLKEKSVSSVATVAGVINTFGRHGHTEGVPWEVQLAAVYCIHNLSPCNPKHALDALGEWRGDTPRRVPPAVTSYINQLASICRQVKC